MSNVPSDRLSERLSAVKQGGKPASQVGFVEEVNFVLVKCKNVNLHLVHDTHQLLSFGVARYAGVDAVYILIEKAGGALALFAQRDTYRLQKLLVCRQEGGDFIIAGGGVCALSWWSEVCGPGIAICLLCQDSILVLK